MRTDTTPRGLFLGNHRRVLSQGYEPLAVEKFRPHKRHCIHVFSFVKRGGGGKLQERKASVASTREFEIYGPSRA